MHIRPKKKRPQHAIHLRFTIYDLRFTIYDLRFTIWKECAAELRENSRRLQGRLAKPQGCPSGAKATDGRKVD